MKKLTLFGLICTAGLFLAGGFLAGLWPYGLGPGNLMILAFIAGWYLSLNTYILLSAGLGVAADGLTGSVDFVNTKIVLLVVLVIMALRHLRLRLDKTQIAMIIGAVVLVELIWSFQSSNLYLTWGIVFNGIIALIFWLILLKLFPSPQTDKLFGS